MLFLTASRQCQSTEGKAHSLVNKQVILDSCITVQKCTMIVTVQGVAFAVSAQIKFSDILTDHVNSPKAEQQREKQLY